MGEQDPMTLNTLFRIGKLHYLAGRTDEAMVILGETLSKQEKLLGFDNAEVTLTRDLLNRILGEQATVIKVTEDDVPLSDFEQIGPTLPDFLRPKDQNTTSVYSDFEQSPPVEEKSNDNDVEIPIEEETKANEEKKGDGTNEKNKSTNKSGGFFQSIKRSFSLGSETEKESSEN